MNNLSKIIATVFGVVFVGLLIGASNPYANKLDQPGYVTVGGTGTTTETNSTTITINSTASGTPIAAGANITITLANGTNTIASTASGGGGGFASWTNFSIPWTSVTNGFATNTVTLFVLPISNAVYAIHMRGNMPATNITDDVVVRIGVPGATDRFSGGNYSTTNNPLVLIYRPDLLSMAATTNVIATYQRSSTNTTYRTLAEISASTNVISVLYGVIP